MARGMRLSGALRWPGIVNRRSITIGTCATRAGFRARTAMHHLITRGLAATPGSPETIECGCGLLYRPLRRKGTEASSTLARAAR